MGFIGSVCGFHQQYSHHSLLAGQASLGFSMSKLPKHTWWLAMINCHLPSIMINQYQPSFDPPFIIQLTNQLIQPIELYSTHHSSTHHSTHHSTHDQRLSTGAPHTAACTAAEHPPVTATARRSVNLPPLAAGGKASTRALCWMLSGSQP